ncbi:MAG: DMT family transporter [Candidatus Peribacteraceae bacterium]|nr:DMT family transporter [Candidatus Peribacteraceae bacterium]
MNRTKKLPSAGRAIGWIALAISIVASGTYNGFGKNLTDVLSPYSILLASEFVMALLVLVAFGAVPTARDLGKLKGSTWKAALVVSLASAVAGPILWLEGLQRTTATNASLFVGVELAVTMGLASLWLGQRFSKRQLLGAGIAVVGIAFTFILSLLQGVEPRSGDLLLLLGTIIFCSSNVCFRRYLLDCDPRLFLAVRICVAIVTLCLISPFLQVSMAHEILNLPTSLILSLVAFAAISRFTGMFGYYTAVEHLPLPTVSLCGSTIVISSLLMSHWLTGEPLLWTHGVSAVLIVAGTLVFELPMHGPRLHPVPVPLKAGHH